MKLVIKAAVLTVLLVVNASLSVRGFAEGGDDSSQAQQLLLKMINAERVLHISGEQVTVLYRPEQTFTSAQTIERAGNRALKFIYHSPDALDGQTYVDNGKVAWYYLPAKHTLKVGISSLCRFEERSNSILRRLANHELTAQIIGQDNIAGQSVDIVKVTTQNGWGEHRYWIDPDSGAQLKIQTFGALGQLVSQSYFTKLDIGTHFKHGEFGAPPISSDVDVVPLVPRGSQTLTGLPTSTQCGFPPTTPSFIPPGFTLQSTIILPIEGVKMLGLTYANYLVTLSIFEQPIDSPPGQEKKDKFKTPRQGVLTARYNGYQYIVIGSLPSDVMDRIVKSMH
jgi:hypothetical protein